MNITQVYLTPNYDDTEPEVRYGYQIQTNYIQLFLEERLRKYKLALGKFNRLVFSEGGDASKDYLVIGNNALPVAISRTYEQLESIKTDRDAHNYFVSKYVEGFKKIDKRYSSSLADYLVPLVEEKFGNELLYEKVISSKNIDRTKIEVVTCYSRNTFKLIANIYEKNKLTKSHVIAESAPDMFSVKYNVHKVNITNSKIQVVNKVNESYLDVEVAKFI